MGAIRTLREVLPVRNTDRCDKTRYIDGIMHVVFKEVIVRRFKRRLLGAAFGEPRGIVRLWVNSFQRVMSVDDRKILGKNLPERPEDAVCTPAVGTLIVAEFYNHNCCVARSKPVASRSNLPPPVYLATARRSIVTAYVGTGATKCQHDD